MYNTNHNYIYHSIEKIQARLMNQFTYVQLIYRKRYVCNLSEIKMFEKIIAEIIGNLTQEFHLFYYLFEFL